MENSQAYLTFKERIQEIFNFAVLVTSSVPVLKQNLKLFKDSKIKRLPEPDYFEPSVLYEIKSETIKFLLDKGIPTEQIDKLKEIEDIPLNSSKFKNEVIGIIGEAKYKEHRNSIKLQSLDYVENLSTCTSDYQSKLAAYLYFSMFSFFESFIYDIIQELIVAMERIDKNGYFDNIDSSIEYIKNKKNLNKEYDPRKIDKYKKLTKLINERGYKQPKVLVFSSLIDLLQTRLEDLKANEIPDFLEKYFNFKFQEGEKESYHDIRSNRNSIGHGNANFTPNLGHVIRANKFFKKISREINGHVTSHFFDLTNYQE